MKKLIIIVGMLMCLCVKAQDKKYKYSRGQFQGIWKGVEMSRDPFADITQEYVIYKGSRMLMLNVETDWFYTVYFGFNEYFSGDMCPDENMDARMCLLEKGDFYYTVDEDGASVASNPPPEFVNVTENILEIPWSIYEKIEKLPQVALKKLYQRSINNKRNYIYEFLDMYVREITADKTYIYREKEGNNKTDMYLVKDDIIEVISAYSKCINFRYQTVKGEMITGWVKREDVSEDLDKIIKTSKK